MPRVSMCCAVLITVLLVSAHAVAGPSTARQLLRSAFERERTIVGGRLRLYVESEQGGEDLFSWVRMAEELGDGAYLGITWHGDRRFRIAMEGPNGHIRTIVSDGRFIDTGNDMLWDVKFLDGLAGYPEGAAEEFEDLMWPYRVFRLHIFPLAPRTDLDYESLYFNRVMTITASEPLSPEVAEPIIKLDVRPPFRKTVSWQFWIDPGHSNIVSHFQETVPDSVITQHDYELPLRTEDGFWLMGAFRYRWAEQQGDDATEVRWKSTIVTDNGEHPMINTASGFSIQRDAHTRVILLPEQSFVSWVGELFGDAFVDGFDADYMWVYLAVLGCVCIIALTLRLVVVKWRARYGETWGWKK